MLYPREMLAPGSVWTCAKNLAPTGIRFPDRPARSQSLYRLSYRLTVEEIEYSETLAFKLKRPGNNPEESMRHSKQDEKFEIEN
jgi:hypothetical protein